MKVSDLSNDHLRNRILAGGIGGMLAFNPDAAAGSRTAVVWPDPSTTGAYANMVNFGNKEWSRYDGTDSMYSFSGLTHSETGALRVATLNTHFADQTSSSVLLTGTVTESNDGSVVSGNNCLSGGTVRGTVPVRVSVTNIPSWGTAGTLTYTYTIEGTIPNFTVNPCHKQMTVTVPSASLYVYGPDGKYALGGSQGAANTTAYQAFNMGNCSIYIVGWQSACNSPASGTYTKVGFTNFAWAQMMVNGSVEKPISPANYSMAPMGLPVPTSGSNVLVGVKDAPPTATMETACSEYDAQNFNGLIGDSSSKLYLSFTGGSGANTSTIRKVDPSSDIPSLTWDGGTSYNPTTKCSSLGTVFANWSSTVNIVGMTTDADYIWALANNGDLYRLDRSAGSTISNPTVYKSLGGTPVGNSIFSSGGYVYVTSDRTGSYGTNVLVRLGRTNASDITYTTGVAAGLFNSITGGASDGYGPGAHYGNLRGMVAQAGVVYEAEDDFSVSGASRIRALVPQAVTTNSEGVTAVSLTGATNDQSANYTSGSGQVKSVALSLDGTRFYSNDSNGKLYITDPASSPGSATPLSFTYPGGATYNGASSNRIDHAGPDSVWYGLTWGTSNIINCNVTTLECAEGDYNSQAHPGTDPSGGLLANTVSGGVFTVKSVTPTGITTTLGTLTPASGTPTSLVETATGPGATLTGQVTWGLAKAGSATQPYIWEFNTSTWSSHQLTVTGATASSTWIAIASAGTDLFVADSTKVYKVNKATGAATLVWTTASTINDIRTANAGGTGVLFAATSTGLYKIL
jgi:hypothetical protein